LLLKYIELRYPRVSNGCRSGTQLYLDAFVYDKFVDIDEILSILKLLELHTRNPTSQVDVIDGSLILEDLAYLGQRSELTG
jgi:hypothetical protein